MTRPIRVRWLTSDGQTADPADPRLRELIRRTVEEALGSLLNRRAA